MKSLCLAITKQFVYDEKKITMKELTHALSANWEGYEALRDEILQRGNFFGNDDECSNEMAQLLMGCFNEWNNTETIWAKSGFLAISSATTSIINSLATEQKRLPTEDTQEM